MSARRRERTHRALDDPNGYLKMIEERVNRFEEYSCMIPVSADARCGLPCCGSHSVQEAMLRDRLVSPFGKNRVLDFRLNPLIGYLQFALEVDTAWPRQNAYGNASLIPFACGQPRGHYDGDDHDGSVFRLIEGEGGADVLKEAVSSTSGKEEELFLFSYRACLSTLGQIMVMERKIDVNESLLIPSQRPNGYKQNVWRMHCENQKGKLRQAREKIKWLMGSVAQIQRSMDRVFLNGSYEQMEHVLIQFDSEVRIAAASAYFESFLTILPDDAGGIRHTALISWVADSTEDKSTQEREERSGRIRELSSDWRELLRHVVDRCFNVYTSPNYRTETDAEFQAHIHSDMEKKLWAN